LVLFAEAVLVFASLLDSLAEFGPDGQVAIEFCFGLKLDAEVFIETGHKVDLAVFEKHGLWEEHLAAVDEAVLLFRLVGNQVFDQSAERVVWVGRIESHLASRLLAELVGDLALADLAAELGAAAAEK
jgi:hypothetical protein